MSRQNRQRAESLARRIRFILGKSPDEAGLVLESDNWLSTKLLVQALSEEDEWRGIRVSQISDLAWQIEESPFEFDETRIRLRPTGNLDLIPPQREELPTPPILFYGCRRKPYAVYRQEGLSSHHGREIVLARTAEMAIRIAQRREPKPILIEVHTQIAQAHGDRFLAYGQYLFVTTHTAPEALTGPPVKEEPRPKLKAKKPAASATESLPHAPHPDSFHPTAWNPSQDRLLARDPDELKKVVKREREKRRVAWKEEARGRRKGEA